MDASLITLLLNLCFQMTVLSFVAFGLVLVFGKLGVLNLAHGEFLTLGAFAMVGVQNAGLPFILGLPVAVLAAVIVGYGAQRLIVHPLRNRPLDTLLATWGLSILMRKTVEAFFGRQYQSVNNPLPNMIEVFGAPYPTYRLALMLFVLLMFSGLWLWYRSTTIGARLHAVMHNPELAEAVGINVQQMSRWAFIFGVSITALAGSILAPLVKVEPFMGLDYLLNSFFVMIVGGMGNFAGLATGSGVVGGAQTIIATIFDQVAGYMAVLALSIVIIWRRPNGLFTRK